MQKTIREIPEVFEGKTYLDPKFEPAFFELFDDKPTLTDFLNAILHLDEGGKIDHLEFRFENELKFRIPEPRSATFDIFAHTEDNRFLDIEMQRARHPFFIDRVFLYSAFLTLKGKQLYKKSSAFKKLDSLEQQKRRYELPEIISIWICDFHPREGVTKYRDEWGIYSKNDLENGNVLPVTTKIKYILVDLPNFVKHCNKIDSKEQKWLYLLANAGSEKQIPQMGDDLLQRAIERITINLASEDLLNRQEKSMIAYDEIICQLADGKIKAREVM